MVSAIQTGSNWWINLVARFPGTVIINPLKMGTIREYYRRSDPLDEVSDLNLSVTAQNNDQETQVGTHGEQPTSTYSPVQRVARKMDANEADATDAQMPLDSVPVTTIRFGVSKSEQHEKQSVRTDKFADKQESTLVDPAQDSFNASFAASMLSNPVAALSSFNPGSDRKNLIALLSN